MRIYLLYLVLLTNESPFVSSKGSLGVVEKCTLVGNKATFQTVYTFTVGQRKYCLVEKGMGNTPGMGDTQSEAMQICKLLNAKLPLPKNEAEYDAFQKYFIVSTWLGIHGIGKFWKDIEGNSQTFTSIKWHQNEPKAYETNAYWKNGGVYSAKGHEKYQTICVQEIIGSPGEHPYLLSSKFCLSGKVSTTTQKSTTTKGPVINRCTLPKGAYIKYANKDHCMSVISEKSMKQGKDICESFNAKLPQPQNLNDNQRLLSWLSGVFKISLDIKVRVYLDMTDPGIKGTV